MFFEFQKIEKILRFLQNVIVFASSKNSIGLHFSPFCLSLPPLSPSPLLEEEKKLHFASPARRKSVLAPILSKIKNNAELAAAAGAGVGGGGALAGGGEGGNNNINNSSSQSNNNANSSLEGDKKSAAGTIAAGVGGGGGGVGLVGVGVVGGGAGIGGGNDGSGHINIPIEPAKRVKVK